MKKTLRQLLAEVYSLNDLTTTCCRQCTCCRVACPQMNYSEACQILDGNVFQNWTRLEKRDLLLTCLKYFFSDSLIKPCPMLSGTGCKIYIDRPLNCVLPGTWIYTSCGPEKIENIKAGDMVYGHDGKLHLVRTTRSSLYLGFSSSIRHTGTHIPAETTAEHRWLCAFQKDKRKTPDPVWVETINIKDKRCKESGHYLSFPKKWDFKNEDLLILNSSKFVKGTVKEGNRLLPFTSGKLFEGRVLQSIPSEFIINEEFLFMLGIYIAEGSSTSQSSSFSMHIEEKPILERIKVYLESCGIRCHWSKTKRTVKVLRVDSCLFARMMSNLCGHLAQNKNIHKYLMENLSQKQLMQIYKGWNLGDGRKTLKRLEESTVTISERLAVQMGSILLRESLFPRTYISRRDSRGNPSYDVHLYPSNFRKCKSGQGTKNMSDSSYIYSPCRVEQKEYNGPVFDLDVEDAESFVTTSGIVHNCRMYGLWPDEVWESRVEGFSNTVGLPREQLPLNKQCSMVNRTNGSALTEQEINGMFSALETVDRQIGDLDEDQIAQNWHVRTLHDWILLKFWGEDRLISMTELKKQASPEDLPQIISVFEGAAEKIV